MCLVESLAEKSLVEVDGVVTAKDKRLIVVGIPAFNEERTIARVVIGAQRYADVVVVCDDGSSDLTGEIAERLGAEVVRHEKNLGYGAALRSLFKRARELNADVFVTLDADGQHDPAEIPIVVEPVIDGEADVVIGSRFVDESLARAMPWYRRAGIKFITRLVNNSSKYGVKDAQSGFRAYSRKALQCLSLLEDGMGVSVEILLNARKCGLKIKEVSASCAYSSVEKTSHKNPFRHGAEVIMAIIKLVVEEKPLLFCLGLPGIILLFAGAFFGAWMLQIYAVEHRIVTNIALAAIAFILIGLFALFTAITLYAISRLAKKTNSWK